MALVEHQILSKVLEEGNFPVLNKFNIKRQDFYTIPQVYDFIKDYYNDNGNVPDYRTVVGEFEDFDYMPEVVDNFKYLAKSIKSATGKRQAVNLLQEQAGKKFQELSGQQFTEWLYKEAEALRDSAQAESYTGENYATTGADRWQTYEDSKEQRTHKFIPTPYPSLTEYLGGGTELGDYVLLQAYTNRGKSWIASDIGVRAWESGHGVLHYSPELSYDQQAQRNDTLLGHFNNTALKVGNLNNESEYKGFLLDTFREDNDTPYIIKTMKHLQHGLSLDTITADLQANPDISMVIIDGFNLMDHKGRNGNRDNMSNTSRKLRQLFSRYSVVGLVVHQTPTSAEKENNTEDETGARIPTPPDISQYSETIAVIQDAVTVLSFDQFDGIGKIKIAKSRTPNVGKEIDLHCDFNMGYITERTVVDYI